MTYNAIELAAYEPTSDITQSVYVLRVPGELREALDKLYRSACVPQLIHDPGRVRA